MERIVAVSQNRDCWICFNNENNVSSTAVDTKNILKQCETYLDTSITMKSFENETTGYCCSYCYESTHQLTLLEDQIRNLQKEISDLGLLFSKNVVERRSRVKAEKDESVNKSIPPTHIKTLGNLDRQSIVVIKSEVIESESKEIPSNSAKNMETIGRDDLATGVCFHPNEPETLIKEEFERAVDSEGEIDVEFSYSETASINEPNEQLAAANANDDQQVVRIHLADLLKCLKMPIIKLKRCQSCNDHNSKKTTVDDTFCDFKLETFDPDCYDTNMEHNFIAEEKTCPPEACQPELIYNQADKPLQFNQTFIAGEENMKSEEDIDKPNKSSDDDNTKDHNKLHDKKYRYECSFCDKTFLKPSMLIRHERFHTDERPFKCPSCSKAFKRADNLKRHEIFHCTEKAHQCSICEKSFSKARFLVAHAKIHSGLKPFKCHFCDKSFRTADHVKKHEIFHTRERPYKCSFCQKSFCQLIDLKRHEIIHSEEGPYKCSFCSKSFCQLSDAKRHEKIHTGERPHKCSICEKSFKRNYHLIDHRKRLHKQSTEEFILP